MLSYKCNYKTLVDEEGCDFEIEQNVILKQDNADDPEALKVYTLDVIILMLFCFSAFEFI